MARNARVFKSLGAVSMALTVAAAPCFSLLGAGIEPAQAKTAYTTKDGEYAAGYSYTGQAAGYRGSMMGTAAIKGKTFSWKGALIYDKKSVNLNSKTLSKKTRRFKLSGKCVYHLTYYKAPKYNMHGKDVSRKKAAKWLKKKGNGSSLRHMEAQVKGGKVVYLRLDAT